MSKNKNLPELKTPIIGIGMDCSVTPIKDHNLMLVQTTDFFYPLVDDPYIMGKIACANVLSDLYALGVTECDNILMLVGVPIKMSEKEREVIIPMMMKGFLDTVMEAGSTLTGGHTTLNPWCMIGGTATSVCLPTEYIAPYNAQVGDVMVLTKPLGTQMAIKSFNWLENKEIFDRVKALVSQEEIEGAHRIAVLSMARLNRYAAVLMHRFNAHCATDVTGFGLQGHADNLAKNQKAEVTFVIHNLPIIGKMLACAKACGMAQRMLEGTLPETSGGLLICFERTAAAAFCKEIEKEEGCQSWIIGIVEKGERKARIIEKPRIIEVPCTEVC